MRLTALFMHAITDILRFSGILTEMNQGSFIIFSFVEKLLSRKSSYNSNFTLCWDFHKELNLTSEETLPSKFEIPAISVL